VRRAVSAIAELLLAIRCRPSVRLSSLCL